MSVRVGLYIQKLRNRLISKLYEVVPEAGTVLCFFDENKRMQENCNILKNNAVQKIVFSLDFLKWDMFCKKFIPGLYLVYT